MLIENFITGSAPLGENIEVEMSYERFRKVSSAGCSGVAPSGAGSNARLYEQVTYEQVLRDKLRVMDLTAITLLMERKLPLVVFNLKKEGNIMRVLRGERVGTAITPG